jgi:hypothetical protein
MNARPRPRHTPYGRDRPPLRIRRPTQREAAARAPARRGELGVSLRLVPPSKPCARAASRRSAAFAPLLRVAARAAPFHRAVGGARGGRPIRRRRSVGRFGHVDGRKHDHVSDRRSRGGWVVGRGRGAEDALETRAHTDEEMRRRMQEERSVETSNQDAGLGSNDHANIRSWLRVSAPLLIDVTTHFFMGAAPYVLHELSDSDQNNFENDATTFGVSFLLGGWL